MAPRTPRVRRARGATALDNVCGVTWSKQYDSVDESPAAVFACALTHQRGRGARAGQQRPLCAALGSSAQATARIPLKPPSNGASSSVSRCRLHSPPPPWTYS